METLINRVQKFLEEHTLNVISVNQDNRKLSKESAPRYSFSLKDIEQSYGSVENFIKYLPEQGFTENVKIILRIYYPNTNSYRNKETLSVNFKKQAMNTSTTILPTPQPAVPSANPFPNWGMGYTQVPQMEWIGSEVRKERFEDLKKELERTREELLDAKSKLRIAEEKAASLKISLDTAEEKSELKLQKELLNKKGFFESPAFEKISEGLGAILPVIAEKMTLANATPAIGMGAPQTSEVKQQFINIILSPNVTDEQVGEWYNLIFNNNEQQ